MTVSTGAGGGGAVVVSAGGFCGVQAPARNAIITRLGIQRFKFLAILYKSRDLPPGGAASSERLPVLRHRADGGGPPGRSSPGARGGEEAAGRPGNLEACIGFIREGTRPEGPL